MSLSSRLYIPVYAVTLLLSAFLLFLIQPLFGKMILPMLGGSPAVWNTAMLFFQMLLLAGYAYAHGTSRFLTIRTQALFHVFLLILFIFVLPIAIPENWTPPTETDPTFWQLGLMFMVVGGPFFVLSGSAPMLQHWFAHTTHKDSHNPYFLYGASNLGSMSALLIYPFLIEPVFNIDTQSFFWAWGYGLLIFCIIGAMALVWKQSPLKNTLATTHKTNEIITWTQRILWILLAFIPSSLMLGVTTYITTDIASAPLLWIPPLALYVSTFIIAFARKPFPSHRATLLIQGGLLIVFLSLQVSFIPLDKGFPLLSLLLHLLLFFFTALMCHHELAKTKPSANHLTQFYLFMSLGGALGGFFNAIIAPNIFDTTLEYGLILTLAAFMRFSSHPETNPIICLKSLQQTAQNNLFKALKKSGVLFILVIVLTSQTTIYMLATPKIAFMSVVIPLYLMPLLLRKRWVFGFCTMAILLLHAPGNNISLNFTDDIQYQGRNFFGILRVSDDAEKKLRLLLHGTTIHGTQALSDEYKLQKLSYYSAYSPLKDAFYIADHLMETPQSVAVLGLGVGQVACYAREDRHFDFFEIDPAVVRIAEDPDFFTYLSHCGSPYNIILGDARLQIMEQPKQSYDFIFIDVFSSDNIPLHIMTYEAFAGYQQQLKDHGFIVANISNRYLDLKPILAAMAPTLGMTVLGKYNAGGILEDSGLPYTPSEYALLTGNPDYISYLKQQGWRELNEVPGIPFWTDQYSNILSVFRAFQIYPGHTQSH